MIRILAAATLAALTGALASLSLPAGARAFTLTGKTLDLDNRDFRVFNNFADPTANDNTVEQANFPGAVGATLAIWKAHVEWASGPYAGTGAGDPLPSNPVLGDGGANFDNTYQGEAAGPGAFDGKVHSAAPGLGAGILAITDGSFSDGWRIRFNEDALWDDGPGAPVPGAIDIQGVATRQIGFTLGLGVSSVPGATMAASGIGDGTSLRSIEADDAFGVRAIYGTAAATKPRVDGLDGSRVLGGTLTLIGADFAAAGNEVWFTAEAATGTPSKVLGVRSSGGGATIDVAVPADARDGEVLVLLPTGSGGARLSNAFPLDVAELFTHLGPGLAGAFGEPVLAATGDYVEGGPTPIGVSIEGAAPFAPATLLVGTSEAALPFKGGTLFLFPIVLNVPLGAVGPTGALAFGAELPAGLPSGATILLQTWFVDATGPKGLTATNGLRIDVP